MPQSVLVIAPHPDDEAIGCGGTLCLHAQRGDRIQVAFLTSGERGIPGAAGPIAGAVREGEARAAGQVLGLDGIAFLRLPDLGLQERIGSAAQHLHEVLQSQPPGIIYLPHPEDDHPDHQAALPLVRAALARFSGRTLPELRLYEVWSPMTRHGWAEDISPFMAQKLRAVRCYQSQLQLFRYDRAVQGLNRYRGCLAARCRYAEVFQDVGAELSTNTG
jgi:LmbE family N-acetylglucosaminyl deacetylase